MNIQDPRALIQHKAPSEQSLFPPAAKVNNDNLKKENTKKNFCLGINASNYRKKCFRSPRAQLQQHGPCRYIINKIHSSKFN
jgi:hypothetical protein